jgi:glycosyltransferase involved in cell wall biosynthesis
MKVLMIAPQPFFEPRGTPIQVYQRLQGLSALQHSVDLLTYHVGQEVTIPGVTFYRSLHVPFIKEVKLGPSWPKAFLDILLFFQAIILLSRNQYDVIHSHEEAAFWSVLLSKVFRTCHVYDMGSALPRQLASVPRWNIWPFVKLFEVLERWAINTCDAVLTIGVDLDERVKMINPAARTAFIPNRPIHTDDIGSSHISAHELKSKLRLDGKLPVVYTGTLERYQGLDLLLESAKIVREHYPQVMFILVGGSPQQVEYWQSRAGACGLEDAVLFTGSVPLPEALAYLDVAEILVSPRTEGMSVPLKIYSYLQSGKPIVATDIFAHSQVLDAEMAILVAPTEQALADGILTLARSPDLRKRLGLRAQQFVKEKFDPADYLAKLDRVYRELGQSTRPAVQTADRPPSSKTRSVREPWLRRP